MKKIFNFALAAAAIAALSLACSKEIDTENENPGENTQEQVVKPAAKTITITATLLDTKVSFDPAFDSGHKPTGMSHTWQTGDQLRVTDENDPTNTDLFDLVSGEGTDTGVFEGTIADAASYSVEVVPAGTPSEGVAQEQAGDGSTAHLKYVAGATHVTDLKNFTLTETSSIIGFIVKLPAGVTETINQVIIEKSSDDFLTKSTLLINITGTLSDVNNDNILEVYANIPSGWEIEADTKMFLRFKSTNANHTVYTRYQEFASAATLNAGEFNYIKMNCSNIDKYAGGADQGSATAPYLIADPYQLIAMDGLLASEKHYFKLLCDIDMNGVTISELINKASPYKPFDFDGNSKTISNFNRSLFYIINNGSVKDLTLDKFEVTDRGILAEYIQGSGNVVSNVTISNGKVNSSSSNVGGLVGQINSGTSGQTTATITGCTVSGTNVKGAGVVGGVIGFANELVSISGCKYTGGTVETSGQYCGGFVGSTADKASVISNCQVENATVKSTRTDDARVGGFVGLTQTNVQIKGCTVGTSTKKVVVNTPEPASSKVLNAGGFVGVNYGTITKNGSVRSQAYAQVTSANTLGQQINIGGFVGFAKGTIEYSDAVVDMSDLQGQYIGGFCGYVLTNGTKVDNCTVSGSVKGNNYTGGFAGYVTNNTTLTNNQVLTGSTVSGQSSIGGFVGFCNGGSVFEDNSSAANLSVRGSNAGGFAGAIEDATMTRCSSTGTVTKIEGTGNVLGGFAGYTDNATLDGCFSKGAVSANGLKTEYVGGFIGQVKPAASNTSDIQNCYAEGDVNGEGRWVGGFIGYIYIATPGTATISKSHASGNVSSTGNYCGGFIGRIQMTTDVSIEKCYATGSVSSTGSYRAGFIGDIDGENAHHTISDCYATGAVNIQNTRYCGGLMAGIQKNPASVTISRCYTASAVSGTFEVGGMIGRTNAANFTLNDCAAWNTSVSASSRGQTNWSSGSIIGVTHPNGHASNNYRNPDMVLEVYCVPEANFDQPDINGTTSPLYWNSQTAPFTWSSCTATAISAGSGNVDAGRWAYHGKHSTTNRLSTLASTAKASDGLGWDSAVWDFSGELPTLR